MYIDKLTELSDSQAVTTTALSTNIADFGDPNIGDRGASDHMELVVQVDTAATASGAATVVIELWTHTTAVVTSGTMLARTNAIGKAALTVGAQPWRIQLPRGCKQFVGLNFTVATGPLTAGAFSAFITPIAQQNIV
jgi:hypothetical protein